MKYDFRCVNAKCNEHNELVTLDLPVAKAGQYQRCKSCGSVLRRFYGGAIKTNDGFKK